MKKFYFEFIIIFCKTLHVVSALSQSPGCHSLPFCSPYPSSSSSHTKVFSIPRLSHFTFLDLKYILEDSSFDRSGWVCPFFSSHFIHFSFTSPALADLYLATKGEKWVRNTNWMDGNPCNHMWEGVTCDGERIVDLLRWFSHWDEWRESLDTWYPFSIFFHSPELYLRTIFMAPSPPHSASFLTSKTCLSFPLTEVYGLFDCLSLEGISSTTTSAAQYLPR